MNEDEMKLLESQLRSLQPRRPSGRLKWRIFGLRLFELPRAIKIAGWATPMTACALTAFLILNSASSISPNVSRAPSILAMMSNDDYAVMETSRQSAQNNLSLFTFDWTNHSVSNSTMRSFLRRN